MTARARNQMQNILALIGNEVDLTTARYAAILGLTPSKGARSPVLWNAAYKAAGADAGMVAMDVGEANLAALVDALRTDRRYLGGAVAVPHKQGLLPLLDHLEPEAARIGAVNAVYRHPDGGLVGANTDGAGALAEITDLVGGVEALAGRRAVMLGLGGAGLAVATYLAARVADLALVNRTRATAVTVAERLGARTIDWPVAADDVAACDLLVNCTTMGYADGPAGSPLTARALAALPATAAVYDVIYQPRKTPLLAAARARDLTARDGLGMNLEQAVIAFDKANPDLLPRDRLRQVMANA